MKVFRPESRTEPVDPATFTGAGELERIPRVSSRPAINAYRVTFEARTRTAWHVHSGPQILLVTEGRCRFQARGEPVQEVGTGGIVAFDPGEEHWHGASADGPMVHLALNVDAETRWLEKVSDEAYDGVAPPQD